MDELGPFLRSLRGKRSLREIGEKAGLSHNYLSIVEKGKDPRSGAPVNPSPETLMKLSEVYGYPYKALMRMAGYEKEESTEVLSDSKIDQIIRETEGFYQVNLHDDPVVIAAMKSLIESIAQAKSKQ